MSLFPAYAEQADLEEPKANTDIKPWLENSSFHINLPNNSKAQTSKDVDKESNENEVQLASISKKRKNKQKHRNSKKKKSDKISLELPNIIENEYFKIEISGAKELLSVPFISRPSAPIYNIKYRINDTKNPNKFHKGIFKRYYKYVNISSKHESEVVLTSQNLNKADFAPRDENFAGFKQEEELSERTGFYNHHLAEKPNDIKVWLEYIQFQDTVHQFEKTYRKGSMAKAQRVLAERKLSIIEKALSLNHDSEILQRERLNIAVRTFPSDELQVYLKDLVEKDKGNIVLWQGYVEATQCSMSHCNTPAVLNLYTKCLSTLHQLRRVTSVERHLLEESILKMLYQCGLFLSQAGLFEQLWTLLRLYLELNLSPNDKNRFNISCGVKESQLVELEDVILTSNLPIHELWLRIEKLRESCHWLPYLNDDKCEDPQRMVFTDDVAELIHPITMPENIFKLTATILSLLKIPLLPCRHTTMAGLGLDYIPWNLDSIEPLLSIYLPLYPVETCRSMWNDKRLAVGPQYLKKIPGHEEYLDFVFKLMETCAKCLTGEDKIATTIWFFRFQRLLIILDKIKLFDMTGTLKKRIKKTFKDFLKLEENRQNEIFYLEYALVEYEFGNLDSCLNIISTALQLNEKSEISIENISNSQKTWCYLHKQLVHLKIKTVDDTSETLEAVKILCKMVLQKENFDLTEDILEETENKFKTITENLLKTDTEKLSCVQHFLPNFYTDWMICHGWFLYLSKHPNKCFTFLADILQSLEDLSIEISWQKEVLYEFYVALLFKYSTEVPASGMVKLLDSVLCTAIENYPNNIFMLSVLEKQQTVLNSLGLRWWRVQNLLLKTDRALASLFAVIVVNQQIEHFQEIVYDTITGTKYDVIPSLKNQMLSLFKKITSGTNSRKCGLIWRLYLQFVYTYFSPEICRNVYYSAVEECPWLKSLYMDAAIYIPGELPQIQDLIIEKQLRLHVTPEELDVLRS